MLPLSQSRACIWLHASSNTSSSTQAAPRRPPSAAAAGRALLPDATAAAAAVLPARTKSSRVAASVRHKAEQPHAEAAQRRDQPLKLVRSTLRTWTAAAGGGHAAPAAAAAAAAGPPGGAPWSVDRLTNFRFSSKERALALQFPPRPDAFQVRWLSHSAPSWEHVHALGGYHDSMVAAFMHKHRGDITQQACELQARAAARAAAEVADAGAAAAEPAAGGECRRRPVHERFIIVALDGSDTDSSGIDDIGAAPPAAAAAAAATATATAPVALRRGVKRGRRFSASGSKRRAADSRTAASGVAAPEVSVAHAPLSAPPQVCQDSPRICDSGAQPHLLPRTSTAAAAAPASAAASCGVATETEADIQDTDEEGAGPRSRSSRAAAVRAAKGAQRGETIMEIDSVASSDESSARSKASRVFDAPAAEEPDTDPLPEPSVAAAAARSGRVRAHSAASRATMQGGPPVRHTGMGGFEAQPAGAAAAAAAAAIAAAAAATAAAIHVSPYVNAGCLAAATSRVATRHATVRPSRVLSAPAIAYGN
jgi:hypothetical protein